MARSYAKIYVSIWADDFKALTRGAQHLYFVLVSNPKLSPAGCVVCQPRKWAKYATGCDQADVTDALEELIQARYVLHDEDTDEVLIRSFIRHDRGFRNQYLRKSIETAVSSIESRRLREHARNELAAAIEDAASPQVGDSEQDPVEESVEESYDHPDEDTCQANYRQQPSTSPSTAASSPGQASTVKPGAAALAMLLEHKVKTEARTNPDGYRASVGPQLREEWRTPLAHYIERHPDATAEELAANVLKVPGLHAPAPRPEWYYDPDCDKHDPYDFMVNTAAEGEPAWLMPCDCRRREPFPAELATIHELRPA
jgi:hypothetical protein